MRTKEGVIMPRTPPSPTDTDHTDMQVSDPSTTGISMFIENRDGKVVELKLLIRDTFAAYIAIDALGWKHVAPLLNFFIGVSQTLSAANVDLIGIRSVFDMLAHTKQQTDAIIPTVLEQHVVGFCYLLLAHAKISRRNAAEIARGLLQDPSITTEQWRKKVDRFAKRKGYASIGTPRPKEKQGRPST